MRTHFPWSAVRPECFDVTNGGQVGRLGVTHRKTRCSWSAIGRDGFTRVSLWIASTAKAADLDRPYGLRGQKQRLRCDDRMAQWHVLLHPPHDVLS